MMERVIYGIRNCDTMKKARAWLDAQGVAVRFHDYKVGGIDPKTLDRWIDAVSWERLVNRAGTTYRKLPETEKSGLDADKARALMLANPSIIKRPVLEDDRGVTVGFAPDRYAALFDGEK